MAKKLKPGDWTRKVIYGSGYDLNGFQDEAMKTAVYPGRGEAAGLTYTVLGLCGEVGELANKLKKSIRAGIEPDEELLLDELGDVQWYLAAVCSELHTTQAELAKYTIKKLTNRQHKGTLKSR